MTWAQSLTPRMSTVWLPSGMPASASMAHAFTESSGELVGVVEVRVQVERMVLLEHRAEFGGDALRTDDRHARADAHDLDVVDGAHAGDDLLELVVGEYERIAAPSSSTSRTSGERSM